MSTSSTTSLQSEMGKLTADPAEAVALLTLESPSKRPDEQEEFDLEYGHAPRTPYFSWSICLSEFKTVWWYSAPLIVSQLLEYSLIVAALVFIGHLSTTQLAGASLGQMTAVVTGTTLSYGVVSALDALIPQAWGSPDLSQKQLVGLWTQRLVVLLFTLQIPVLILWFNSYDLFILLRQEPEIAYYASTYLKWFSLSLPGMSMTWTMRKYFTSVGILHFPSLVVTVVAPLNVLLTYILVLGPYPFLRLGFIGGPIASGISRNLVLLVLLIYAHFYAPREAWHPIDLKKIFDLNAFKLLIKIGVAGVAQTMSEWWSWEILGLAASMLGSTKLAAQSVLLTTASTFWNFPASIAMASAVRVGNLVGMGDGRRARIACIASLLVVCTSATLTGSILFSFRKTWAYLWNDDQEVVQLVARVLPVVAVFQVFEGVNLVTGSLLRVAGLQMVGAVLNLTGYYVIGIPLGLLLTFHFNWGLMGLWLGQLIALVFSATLGYWFSSRTDWVREVGKAKARLNVREYID